MLNERNSEVYNRGIIVLITKICLLHPCSAYLRPQNEPNAWMALEADAYNKALQRPYTL